MTKPNSVDAASLHPIVLRLFDEQALTVSKSGDTVKIQCDNADDSENVFEWLLMQHNDLSGFSEGDGDTIAGRSFDMMANRVRFVAEFLLTAHFGSRCPDFDGGCVVCQKWKQLDQLIDSPYK
jgi:hypothetical protein